MNSGKNAGVLDDSDILVYEWGREHTIEGKSGAEQLERYRTRG